MLSDDIGGGEASYLDMILRIIKNVEDCKSHLPMTLDDSSVFLIL